ncbi:MAG: hypothetical protein K2X93_20970 [Candidatus Obscuribacterales bacterium]|nr:hypothetical protein [Candidatus Obscuribacterales bacterium]
MTTDETTTLTPTAAPTAVKPAATSTLFADGQRVAGKVKRDLGYAFLVKLEAGPTALLKYDQLSGGTNGKRQERRKTLKIGEDVAIEILASLPAKEDDKLNRPRIRVSERKIQEENILASLKSATDTEAGTIVEVRVTEVRDDYLLTEILDGDAKGCQAILHALRVPGDNRGERDEFIASKTKGDVLTAEVLHCKRSPKKHEDLQIALTLVGEAEREELRQLAAIDRTIIFRGQACRSVEGGIEVRFDGLVGLLPANEIHSTSRGDNVKVKVKDVQGRKIILTRA